MLKTWTVEEIREILHEVGEKFNFSCDEVPIFISTRMTRRLGCFRAKINYETSKYSPVSFTFTKDILNGAYSEEGVREIVIHEYIHYYIIIKLQEIHNHDEVFIKYCKLAGIPGSSKFSGKPVAGYKQSAYVLRCSHCGKMIGYKTRKTKIIKNIEKYRSNCCYAGITISKEEIAI